MCVEKTPKVIYIEKTSNADWANRHDLFRDKNLEVVAEEDINDYPYLPPGGSPGDMFLRNPYESNPTFVDIKNAENTFFKTKIQKIQEIFQRLGVKSLEIDAFLKNESTKKINWSASGNYEVVEAKISGGKERKEIQLLQYCTRDTYYGMPDWEDACKYAKDSGLGNDPDVSHFLEEANPKLKNRKLRGEVKCSLSSELNESLDVALKITSPLIGASASYTEILERRQEIELKITYSYE